MAANTEKPVTFGATIETPTKPQPALRSPPSNESDMSAPLASASAEAEKEIGIDSTNPYSAFYKHPEARRSMDMKMPAATATATATANKHLDVNMYEHDVESGVALSTATTQQDRKSVV